ncbi:MAG: hypothetical protein OEY51_01410 [Cyclobacteriaceae bacterium]|nr:hypothetical protein [Cyclobacteriaceae bacterium]
MIEDELITIWKSSPHEERIKFEKSRLMIEAQNSLDRFNKAIKYRDLRETIAAFIVVPVFTYYIYLIPHTLSKIASGLIAVWTIISIIRLKMAKKNKPGPYSVSYLEYLHKTRTFLLEQKRLLDTGLHWFILPMNAFIFLFLAGFIGIPGKTNYIIGMLIASLVLGFTVYYLNKRVVKKAIIPRLEKVEELIKVLEE